MPFDGSCQDEVFHKIEKGFFEIPDYVSKEASDLLYKMLKVKEDRRISARDALNHPFIKQASKDE